MFSGRVSARGNTASEEKIRQCNLMATQLIDKGDLDAALAKLKEAQQLMPKVATEYPISQYVRLGVTLQKAGYFEEAVEELNRLLKKQSHPFNKSSVLDKLRLIHQREGKNTEAIIYAVESLAWECIALEEQNRPTTHLSQQPDTWIKKIKSPLKKLKRPELAEPIAQQCLSFAGRPNRNSVNELTANVSKVLNV